MASEPVGGTILAVAQELSSAKCHLLIEPDAGADHRGFADHYPGTVIDEEMWTDRRAGMDVDASGGIGDLRDNARNQAGAQLVQAVRDAVMQYGSCARIADQYLVNAARRRIALERRFDIAVDEAADLGQIAREVAHDSCRVIRIESSAGFGLPISKLDVDLGAQRLKSQEEPFADKRILRRRRARETTQATGKQPGEQIAECFGELMTIRKRPGPFVAVAIGAPTPLELDSPQLGEAGVVHQLPTVGIAWTRTIIACPRRQNDARSVAPNVRGAPSCPENAKGEAPTIAVEERVWK